LLSVIIPTVGRDTLERTLRSLAQQASALPWEGILVGDTYDRTWAAQLPRAERLANDHPHLRYVAHDGGQHAWGHPQRNYGATVARGRYLAWLGDDDVYLPGAFAAIARAILSRKPGSIVEAPRPRVFLFRWIAPWKQVLWHTAGFLGEEPGHIDAECIVCPNVPARLGTWTNRYQGDFDFIRETIDLWGGLERVAWRPEVIAQAQPSEAEDWTRPDGAGAFTAAPLAAGRDVDVRPLTVLAPVPRSTIGVGR
jgi:glycosyltransferase involved in cell wall biosynthesis